MSAGKVLIADDEPYIVRSLAFVLQREGFEVETASDGEEALAKIREFKPQAVILDLIMPKKTGMEVAHAIVNDPVLRGNLPYIVILTARGDDTERYKGYLEGADEYLTKPFSPSDIVTKVKELFARRE